MEQANYLSLKQPFQLSMKRKNINPIIEIPVIKSKNELMASYNALPQDEKESIREFLLLARNNENQRIAVLEDIKHLSSEERAYLRIQELLRQFNYFNFELSEEERFLQRHCTYRDASLILTNLKRKDYHNVMRSVKNGLRKGVGDFLESNEEICLYFSKLREFVYDISNSVEKRVDEELVNMCLDLEGISDFAVDINASFNTYIYNDYQKRFSNKFCRNY